MNSSEKDNFQSRSTKVGKEFSEICRELLERMGFEFRERDEPLSEYGITIEFVFDNKQGVSLFFEATGTDEDIPTSTRPGLIRTDTVKKIICNAYLANRCTGFPSIVLTSHKPKTDSSSWKMLDKAGRNVIFDVISINDDPDLTRLRSYYDMDISFFDRLGSDPDRSL